jgi:AraC-type DNA-binding domain-containing proteins
MGSPLEVFSDLSERLHYNVPDFPLYVHQDTLHRYGYAAACHWHPDLEFILILDGAMDYFVNGKTVHIKAHNGIFVNSKRLHYGFSTEKADCTFLAVVIHPVLLSENSHAVKIYLDEKFGSNTDDFILLDPKIPWQEEALLLLNRICDEMYGEPLNPLQVLSQAVFLCASMGDHVQQVSDHLQDDPLRTTVLKMTGFIHLHYDAKITLDDIAASGAVCRSKCCELFHQYVGQTPNTYLMRYRIAKSCEMLRETNRTICEVAMTCGFQSASYFASVFHRVTGLLPQDYRKQAALN